MQIYNQMSEAYLSKKSLTEQLIILIAIVVGCIFGIQLLIGLIASQIYTNGNISDISYLLKLSPLELIPLKFLQMMYSIGGFLLPAFIFSRMKSGSAVVYNVGERKPNFMLLTLVPGILFSFFPLIYIVHEINQQIHIPWPDVEAKLIEMNKNSESLMQKFMQDESPLGFAINFLMLAILPALCEEFLFRGALQRILTECTKNFHVAIIISGVAFSIIHGDVYGFLPRAFLGILFGYLVYWGGSIWYSVGAHFLFNGMQAIGMYVLAIQNQPIEPDSYEGLSKNAILLSMALFLFLSYTFFKIANKSEIESDEHLLE